MFRNIVVGILFIIHLLTTPTTWAKDDKPNILIIMGDDIGWFNISYINRGMMNFSTPNIDRIAKGGMFFTDAYAEQSCTAGRSALITGQHPFRTGLLRVGMPGADLGIQPEDPTLATLLRPHGYVSGQFGKNHLGDQDKFLPTNHGFDEFFGNLYHLNAEDEPENPDYPKDAEFAQRFGPRGVIRSWADGKVEDSGPLTKKRMETIDSEFTAATIDFIDRAHADGKPFLAWFAPTRMHVWTRLAPEWEGKTGEGIYADGMAEHDSHVGQVLDHLEQLGIDDNTIVIYTSDNGAEVFTWPDGGMIPFRGEKNTNWEGGYRVPFFIRWPGRIEPGSIANDMISLLDIVPTVMAAVGDAEIVSKLREGLTVNDRSYRVHLDGFDFLPFLTGRDDKGPREEFFYFSDDGNPTGLRVGNWKIIFQEQRAHGFAVWQDPYFKLRMPKIFNLRRDPFERAEIDAPGYTKWSAERLFMLVPAQHRFARFLKSLQEYPPRQKSASFNLDRVMESVQIGER